MWLGFGRFSAETKPNDASADASLMGIDLSKRSGYAEHGQGADTGSRAR